MEPLLFFFKGVAAGFVVAAPVGPVAVLCIRRTIANGLVSGYATGLGAAVADMLYGMVAALGVSFIADFLSDNGVAFRLVGGIVLVVMAVRMALSRAQSAEDRGTHNLIGDFVSALVVTGTNPITLIAFGVVFTTIGVASAGQSFERAEALILGVLVGAMGWWLSLVWLTALLRRSVGDFPILWVNRISAAIVMGCGVLVLIGAALPDSPVGQLIDFSE